VSNHPFYNSRRWRAERKRFLKLHPLCVMCLREGRLAAATVVDHRVPHKGNPRLFWDRANWDALCGPHHNGTKQAIERNTTRGIGEDGWPL